LVQKLHKSKGASQTGLFGIIALVAGASEPEPIYEKKTAPAWALFS
jgi:hypothetical protein